MLSTSETAWEAASSRSEITPSLEEAGRDVAGLDDETSGTDDDGSAIDDEEDDAADEADEVRDEAPELSFREEQAVMERAQEMASNPAINDFI